MPSLIDRVFERDAINFVVTNRIPRRLATRVVGWFSRIEHPIVRDLSMAVWTFFAGDLRLDEARKTTFTSLHDCFVRELKDGARPIDRDPRILISPCDGIVGAVGTIRGHELVQAKGIGYTLEELLATDARGAAVFANASYVTLRLTSSMYHRFHALVDCEIVGAMHVAGDLWNVNPPAVRRIAKLYCRNERAVVHGRVVERDAPFALIAVGAILVGSIHLNFADRPLDRDTTTPLACRAAYRKGEELGYFHHGSTIIVIAPHGCVPCDNVREGRTIRMGTPLLRWS